MALAAQALEAKKAWKAFETCEALGLIAACIKREYEGTNVEVTGAARLYRAASGGLPGWAFAVRIRRTCCN